MRSIKKRNRIESVLRFAFCFRFVSLSLCGRLARVLEVPDSILGGDTQICCGNFTMQLNGAQEQSTACKARDGTASQFDLPSLTPVSVDVCGRVQQGAPHEATSVALVEVVNNWPHKQ